MPPSKSGPGRPRHHPVDPERAAETARLLQAIRGRYRVTRAHLAAWLAPLVAAPAFQIRLWRRGRYYPTDAQLEALRMLVADEEGDAACGGQEGNQAG